MEKVLSTLFAVTLTLFSTFAHSEEKNTSFSMTTNAFLDQGTLPVLYTCDGKDVSPQLSWSNIPEKTQSLALIMSDVDAPKGMFFHWVMFNIPKSTAIFPQGYKGAPAGASLGVNSYSKQQYNGPCPPKGTAHTYFFRLYALDTKLSLPKDANASDVLKAIDKHVIGKAELSAVYSRWIN